MKRAMRPLVPTVLSVCLALAASLCACGGKAAKEPGKADAAPASVAFADSVHNFGVFSADAPARRHTFTFVNTGGSPVSITGVDVSCRCISAGYTREPVRPGGSGQVTLTFDASKSSPGYFNRSARVRFAPSGTYTLRVHGRMKK